MGRDRKEYYISYRNKNKETIKQRQIEFSKKYPERKILRFTKSHCVKRGVEFNLELADIIIPTHCPYLGIELTVGLGLGKRDSAASIDRINPNEGYVRGNVQIISLLANRMKNSATEEQLVTFAENILKLHKRK